MNQSEIFDTESASEKSVSGRAYRPNVDMVENENALTLFAELPGSRAEDIRVEFKDGRLELRASVPQRYKENQTFLRAEFGVGDFFRSFEISKSLDPSRTEANFKDGVLCLTIPKAEEVKPRSIKVTQG